MCPPLTSSAACPFPLPKFFTSTKESGRMFNFPVPLLHTRQFPVAVQFVTFMTDPCEGAKVDWADAPMTFPFWIVTVVPESDLMELELR